MANTSTDRLRSPVRKVQPGQTRLMVPILLAADLATVFLSFLIAYNLRLRVPSLRPLAGDLGTYLNAWPLIFMWPLMFWREGLYPGHAWIGSDYLERILTATSVASLVLMSVTFLTKTGVQYSRTLVIGFWLVSLISLPLSRFTLRYLFRKLRWGGPPAVILGAGRSAALVIRGLNAQNPPSLSPVAVFDDDPGKLGQSIEGVPIIGSLTTVPDWARTQGVKTAIVAMPGIQHEQLIQIIEGQSKFFPRLLVVPNLFGLSTVDVDTRDIGGTLTLEMRKNLLSRSSQALKRLTDYLSVFIIGLLVLPVALAIAIAQLLESGRPVFFLQERVGRAGDHFRMWKFRTMVQDADRVMEDQILEDPVLRAEWEKHQKLVDDPRLTAVGRFIRRFSLDELPQLWNILAGDMSFVGPRPITTDQVELYGPTFHLYKQVRPGLTGLWQVSGRAATSFESRVETDTYYVRNWSLWLDAIIIAKTFWAVISGEGAY